MPPPDGEVHGRRRRPISGSVVDQCYLWRPLLHDEVSRTCRRTRGTWTSRTRCCAPRRSSSSNGEVSAGEKLLASTDTHGQFAGIPVVVQVVNALNKTKPVRKVLDSALARAPGCVAARAGDEADSAGAPKKQAMRPCRSSNGARSAGQGRDLLDLLRQLQRARHRLRPDQDCCSTTPMQYTIVEKESRAAACRSWSWAIWTAWRSTRTPTSRCSRSTRSDGFAILSAIPSCTLMFKQELPLMFPGRRRCGPRCRRRCSIRSST